MTPSEKEALVSVVIGAAELSGRSLSAAGVRLFIQAVEDLDYDAVSMAVSRHVQQNKFFPTPAEIRDACGHGALAIDDLATAQATLVFESIGRVGAYSSVVFDDPVTMSVIARGFGGWESLCMDVEDINRKWFMVEFVKIYKSHAATKVERFGLLPGYFERVANANGTKYEGQPVLIGDKAKAFDVMMQRLSEPPMPARLIALAGTVSKRNG